ncbi:MAG TPA: hypothetical protein VEY10_08450 [Flavisolibacter sp.]|nr:hypothetical protein [Flavisolibacter sp.]
MKKYLPLLFLLTLLLTSTVIFIQRFQGLHKNVWFGKQFVEKESDDEGDDHEDNPEAALLQEFERTKDPALNIVPRERLAQAFAYKNRLASSQSRVTTAVPGIGWLERGPSNVGGRTRGLIYDLNDSTNGYKKVWAGSVGGGLWYTNDITAAIPQWNKINDFFDNLAISALVQNPDNPQEMYFGTGEGWQNFDAIRGLGIYKSSDGGASWIRITTAPAVNFKYVNDLVIDKNGALYATVVQFSNTDPGGVFKSTDKGVTWTQVLGNLNGGFGSSARGADLEVASNGDVYATLGTNGSNGGIYLSTYSINTTNTGNTGTWVNITPNASGVVTTPASLWHRIEIAVAPSDTNVVYALFQGAGSSNCTSIQRYDKATNSWSVKTVPTIIDQGSNSNFTRGQAWYDLIAAVNPLNPNTLYIGGVDALRSIDGGTTWVQMTAWSLFNSPAFTVAQNVHADHHQILFFPADSSRALWGTDGGVYYTTNASVPTGKPIFENKNNSYNVTQFYTVALHPLQTNYFLCGSQDNGTQKFTAPGINATQQATGGDGTTTYIDQTDGRVQISSVPNNNYFVSIDNGATFRQRSFNNNGSFVNPTDYDDASKRLYAANTTGTYFRWNNPYVAGTDTTTVTCPQLTGTVTHVFCSQITPNRVYFGMNNGSVVRVDSAQSGKTRNGVVLKTGTGSVSCVAVDPADENHLLVTYSNYGVVSVFESKNALSASPTWTSVEGNLPDMPVRWALFDPRSSKMALLATEVGIWSTDNLNSSGTDWQPTNSGLANVRVDMIRYRPQDRTIGAATHGRGLFTSVVPNVTTPDINFVTGTVGYTEATNLTTAGCRTYRDYTVQMIIANPPTGTATAVLKVESESTATFGVDFEYTTNGDFNSPSNLITFTSGATTQNITVRVYDDAEVEGDEFFKLSYEIQGTSDAQRGAGFQTLSFNIIDSDMVPTTANATYTAGTLNFFLETSQGATTPFDARLASKRTQILYKASDLAAVNATKGLITSIALPINKRSTRAYQNVTIKMGLSSRTNLVTGGSFFVIPTTTVKNPFTFTPATSTAGGLTFNTFTLDTPFEWDGVSSVVVEFCYNNGTADPANFSDRTAGFIEGPDADGNTIWQDNIDCSGSFSGSGLSNFAQGLRPQIRFTISATIPATALNTTRTEYLTLSNDLYYYSGGFVLARIRSLSALNYGCTEVTIDRAGTGAQPFLNNSPSSYLMDKTYRILPASNYSNGSSEITFYFTAAEKQGWEAATGQIFSNIRVVRVPTKISDVTPATPASDVQVITPIAIGTIGPNFFITAAFSNGLSGGFGFGIPGAVLPVTLLSFTGKVEGNNALLTWQTSSEQNSHHFDIEKAVDGINYRKVGEVKAAGNSNTIQSYGYLDKELLLDKNYYRLKMVDIDDKSKISHVVVLQTTKNQENFTVINNPFSDYIDIRFGKVPQRPVKIQLTDASGKILLTQMFSGLSQNILRFNTSAKFLTTGYYILSAEVDGSIYSAKVLKQ